jgi:hypothetical protein
MLTLGAFFATMLVGYAIALAPIGFVASLQSVVNCKLNGGAYA